ncbi:MAG TPA: hypothetical protein PLV74_09545 [Bacteroidales bacterium]|jgi:hypothetical protein|nr:hypothetical protein [Bacteroidales bacterium]
MELPTKSRKIEVMASRFYQYLGWYELILYPVMLLGAALFFSGKARGGSILLLAALIQAMVYMVLWYKAGMGVWFRLFSFGLSFGLLGSVFYLLKMQSDLLFLGLGFIGLGSGFLLYFRNGSEQANRGILYRTILMLLWVLALGLLMAGIF